MGASPNPFLSEDEEDETESQTGSESTNFKQLRDYAKKLERENTRVKKEAETLKEFQTTTLAERRQAEAAKVFEGVGLAAKHAALYFRVNPEADVTAESVAAFAAEFELPVQAQETAQEVSVSQATDWSQEGIVAIQSEANPSGTKVTGFAPAPPAGSTTAQLITDADVAAKLMYENPQEYVRMHQAGRIKLEKLPGGGASSLPGAS